MTPTTKLLAASALSLGLLGTATPAFADPPHCPPGHEMQGRCDNDDRYRDRDDWHDRQDEREAYREGYEDGQRDAIRYGDRSYNDYRVIRDYDRYGLTPPPSGYYYAQVDNDEVVLVAAATQLIMEFLN